MSHTITITDLEQLQELPGIFMKLKLKLPLKLSFRRQLKRNPSRFDRMNALIRDIVRDRLGRMTITEDEHQREVDRWKRSDAWPRYDDPAPHPDTGEVLYLPKSRADLDDDELKGICNWLDHYIDIHSIKRNGPVDNWQIPARSES